MTILYNNPEVISVIKPYGIGSEEDGIVSVIKNELGCDIYPVHRLDRNTGGVMVFAKTKKAAANLSKQITDGVFKKEYLAVCENTTETFSGTFEDLLFKDSSKNKSFVVRKMRKGVKNALLHYEKLGFCETEKRPLSLMKIRLETGRTHQIRVQFASRKMPLTGDGKYGSRISGEHLGLWSYKIRFENPENKEQISVFAPPPQTFPFNLFDFSDLS